MYKRADVDVHFWVDPDVAKYILSDRDWLMMMLVNLLSNALKFTAAGEVSITATLVGLDDGGVPNGGGGGGGGGGVRNGVGGVGVGVSTRSAPGLLRLTVADTGTGVPAELAKNLFTEWASASRW